MLERIKGSIAVGFDIDGTITDDNGADNIWDREIQRYFGIGRQNNGYDFCSAFMLTPEQVQAFCDDRLIWIYGSVPLKAGVPETIRDLRAAGVAVHLITARDTAHAGVTEDYLERHGIGYDGLWFEPDKVGLCRELGISFFADDKTENCISLRDAGITCLMVDAFHNLAIDYNPRVKDWDGISRLVWEHVTVSAGLRDDGEATA